MRNFNGFFISMWAARALPKFRDCLFVYIFFGSCNLWNEYSLYMEWGPWIHVQMGMSLYDITPKENYYSLACGFVFFSKVLTFAYMLLNTGDRLRGNTLHFDFHLNIFLRQAQGSRRVLKYIIIFIRISLGCACSRLTYLGANQVLIQVREPRTAHML